MTNERVPGQAADAGTNAEYAFILPCKPEDFRDFVGGLLGRPQTITGIFFGPFEVNKSDIENFHHLVVQRVGQQNEGTLVQFTVSIVYDDESSVLLNSLMTSFITLRYDRSLR
jgi:hypothetical protein